MAKRRTNRPYVPHLDIWKRDGDFWFVEKEDLLKHIGSSKHSEDQMRRRMGVGFYHIDQALESERISCWDVMMIEWGIDR